MVTLFFLLVYLFFPYVVDSKKDDASLYNLYIPRLSPYKGPDKPAILWKFRQEGREMTLPLTGPDGTVYIGSFIEEGEYLRNERGTEEYVRHFSDSKLIALEKNGSVKWSFPVEGEVNPVVFTNEGIILITVWQSESKIGKIYALDAEGRKKWEFSLPSEDGNFLIEVTKDGTIYCSSSESPNLYALNLDGKIKWEYEITPYRIDSFSVGPHGRIYIAGSEASNNEKQCWKLFALNARGDLVWTLKGEGSIPCKAAINYDGIIYFATYFPGSEEGEIYAVSRVGQILWRAQIGGFADFILPGPDGTVFTGIRQISTLFAISPGGSIKWKYATDGRRVMDPVVLGNGRMYFGTQDIWLHALNTDGQKIWVFEEPEERRICCPVVDKRGVIYFSCGSFTEGLNGRLYSLNPNGKIKWKFEVDGFCYGVPIIAQDGRIYLTVDSDNNVSTLYAIGEE